VVRVMDYEVEAVKPNSRLKITWKKVGNRDEKDKWYAYSKWIIKR